MGTRGAIARATGEGKFSGRYHHWDSYPSGLGATLWDLYHGKYKGDLQAMLADLIDRHPAGWSTLANGLCYCHTENWDSPRQPHDHDQTLTEKDASDCGAEYVYAFDEPNNEMLILSSYCEDGEKMIGAFGMGDPNATWRVIRQVKLDGPEPDWDKIG